MNGRQTLVVAWIALAVSGYFSLAELRYDIWGETSAGQISDVQVKTKKRNRIQLRGTRYQVVQYTFEDVAGNRQIGEDSVSADWSLPDQPGATIGIEYLKGSPQNSRLVGNSHRWRYVVFAGIAAGLGGWYFALHKGLM